MDQKSKLYIGIDVGGTRMTGVLADGAGRKLHTERRSTDRAGGARAGIAMIEEIARALMEAARASGGEDAAKIERIGIGFGGPVDSRAGIVRMSHHVAGWENFPLRAMLEEKLGIGVNLDNDCNAGALGEWRFGAGRGATDILYINIGTGIGGGVISGGRLVSGATNAAGEIGHMLIDAAGPECTCGRRGCLEALCSGSYIGRRARERVAAGAGLTRLTLDATSKEVFTEAAAGDALALEIVNETADYLAHAIGNAATLVNPEVVILGGGVAEVGEILLGPIRERVRRYALPFHTEKLRIINAELGYDAGVMGAVALAMEGTH